MFFGNLGVFKYIFCVLFRKISRQLVKKQLYLDAEDQLIHKSHFYNLELIEIKIYSTSTCNLISFSNLGCYFKKISITYNLGKNCSEKKEKLFFSEKNSICSQFNIVGKILGL